MTDPPALASDWSYQLGQKFLTAATSCGAVCGRVFVSDGGRPESPPPGSKCECQLAAVVTEGWQAVPGAGGSNCSPQRVAEIRLVLDLCQVVPGQNEILRPAKVNTSAQSNATTRWLIMEGLRKAWVGGLLSAPGEVSIPGLDRASCRRIMPGRWLSVSSAGGVARWESVWTFHDHE